MRKLAIPLLSAVLLSGCAKVGPDLDFPDLTPFVFESLPYPERSGRLCGMPLPVPSPALVVRTVVSLAGPSGSVRLVPLPTGWAIAVWTNGVRAKAIRRYMTSLVRRKTVRAEAVLVGNNRKPPLWRRTLSVPEGSLFLASRWQDDSRTVEVDGFFMVLGSHATPVLSVRETGPGWSSCKTLAPDSSSGRTIGSNRLSIRKGTETLTFSWENPDAKK